MPRAHKNKGQKNKGHTRVKHHHAQGDSQGAKPSVVRESASPPVSQGSDLGAGSSDDCAVCAPRAFQAETFNQPICKDALTKKASMLVEFLLEKFQKSEEFTDEDMLNVVNKKYKTQFSDILRKSSSRMEMIFGMRLKKINPNSQSYAIVSKLGLSTDEILSGKRGLPKMGLLMTILGLIFTKGNRATEEEVWKFLNVLGVYAGKKHLIFGEPRKLITKDLVEQNYLEIHKMSEGKSSRYDFLWGSRAHVETSKMKVLEVWARINDTVPSFFPTPYEEALKDAMERAEQGYPDAMANVHPMSCNSSHK
ncbi:melanoma-associated antigen B4-like [Mesocricetus auratus]|uniref:Melanoma-associated antigen B4-like n=1 Tax=Mesocricetus auratus TaxID=10036 RepID=A0A1U7QJA8_MESAU|nr:melanoma-associated antigen B4-like [Mesocricetus auratus]